MGTNLLPRFINIFDANFELRNFWRSNDLHSVTVVTMAEFYFIQHSYARREPYEIFFFQ